MNYIANLSFGAWNGRLSLEWAGKGDGNAEFREVMKIIETTIGPQSKTIDLFQATARKAFKSAGFEEIRR